MSVNPCKDCITFAICRTRIHPFLNEGSFTLLARYCQFIESKCERLTDYVRTYHETEKHKIPTINYKSVIQRAKFDCEIIRKTFR